MFLGVITAPRSRFSPLLLLVLFVGCNERSRQQAVAESSERKDGETERARSNALAEHAQAMLELGDWAAAQAAAQESLTHAPNSLARGVSMQVSAQPLPAQRWSVVTPQGCVAIVYGAEGAACATLGGVDLYFQQGTAARHLAASPAGWQRQVRFVRAADVSWVVASGDDRVVRAWPAPQFKEPLTLGKHTSDVAALAVSPKRDDLLSIGREGDVLRWRAGEPAASARTLVAKGILDAAWCTDSTLALATDEQLILLDVGTLKEKAVHPGRASRLACAPEGGVLYAQDNRLKRWKETGDVQDVPTNGAELTALTASGARSFWGDARGQLIFREAAHTFVTHVGATVQALAVSTFDLGDELAVATVDRQLQVWTLPKTPTGNVLKAFAGDEGLRQAFTLDNKTTLALRRDGVAGFFEEGFASPPRLAQQALNIALLAGTSNVLVATPQGVVRPLDETTAWVVEKSAPQTLAVSADFTLAAWSLSDGTLVLWSALFKKEILRTREERVRGLAFSPSGRELAVARGKRVAVLDAQTGESHRVLEEHAADVQVIRWLPNGALLTASLDGHVRSWNKNESRLLMTVPAAVTAAATSSRWAAWGTRAGNVYLWDLEQQRLHAEARLGGARIIALLFSAEKLTAVAQDGRVTALTLR